MFSHRFVEAGSKQVGYIYLLGLALTLWALLFYNVHALVWFFSATILFILGYYCSYTGQIDVNLIWPLVFYCGFLFFYVTLTVNSVRKKLITKHVINPLKNQLPKISTTEAQAIEAGDVWWEGDIFSANIDWQKVRKHKIPALSELTLEEQEFLSNKVDGLCELLSEWDISTKDKDLSAQAWQYIKINRFLAIHIPKEYGGLDFSASAHSAIVTKVASKSITAAVSIMVPNSLGPGELLKHYGTQEQKAYYLPRLACGDEIPCFALTSEHAGSDAGGMIDSGVICKKIYNGQEILGIKLNFSKRYITLAPIATVLGLAFKLYDPELLYGNKKELGITLALIPTNTEGVEIGNRHLAMMVPFQNGPVRGKDVFIPMDYLIGGTKHIGNGWFMLMECLSGGRGISLPALSTATCQVAYLSSFIYSNLRIQFKSPIVNLEGIQEQLAQLAGYVFIANAVRSATVSAVDHNLKPAVISAITKYHMTELSRKAINCAMDIHGGKGVMNGPDNYLISYYIANPVSITVEGANILTRNLIIFGQGAFRAHPYVLAEIAALNDANTSSSLDKFDNVLFKHIKFVFSNIARIKAYSIQRIYYRLVKKNNIFRAYKKDLTRLSCALALATDLSLLFIGGKLKIKERLSARLADLVSNIYMAVCVIKYYEDLTKDLTKDLSVTNNALDYQYYAQWAIEFCLYNAQQALLDFINNFPVRVVKIYLKLIIFPWGVSYKKPADLLDFKLSQLSQNNNVFEKLTELVYFDKSENNKTNSPLDILIKTYRKKLETKSSLDLLYHLATDKKINYSNSLFRMIKDAYDKNLISEQDYEKLKNYSENLDKVINVNDFEKL
jgi:alkylation response protein AidB-like acyl-CoA dehydrogenase